MLEREYRAEAELVCPIERCGSEEPRWICNVSRGINEVLIPRHAVEPRQRVSELEGRSGQERHQVRCALLQRELQRVVHRATNWEQHRVLAIPGIDSAKGWYTVPDRIAAAHSWIKPKRFGRRAAQGGNAGIEAIASEVVNGCSVGNSTVNVGGRTRPGAAK